MASGLPIEDEEISRFSWQRMLLRPVLPALAGSAMWLVAGLLIVLVFESWLPLLGTLSIFSVFTLAAIGTFAWMSKQSYQTQIEALSRSLTQTEAELNREEKRSQALLENAVDGILLSDDNGIILSANPATGKLFRCDPDGLIGQNVWVLAGGKDRDRHDAYIHHHLTTGEKRIIGKPREVLGQRADGSTFPVDLSVARMDTESGTFFIGVLRDLTDRVALEEQLRHAQKLEVVGQLTGGIAHDFNNLLGIVEGNLGMLQSDLDAVESYLPGETRILAQEALEAAERGAELTRGLLAYSRKQALNPKPLDVMDTVDRMKALLTRTLGEGIDLRIVVTGSGGHAFADRSQLESAILNMAVNARDALDHKGMLTIETSDVALDAAYAASHEEVTEGDYVLIAVSDNGPGMSEEILTRVLEPFFTTKEVGKGSGLGLSQIYGFAKQSGGHLSIYSELDVGTTVKLYLPRSDVAGTREDTSRVHNEADHKGHERILVVEDDEALRRTITRILNRSGYDVLVAEDGLTALDILGGTPDIDLLLTDVVLGGALNGPELVEAAEDSLGPIRVLYMSGYTKEAVMHRGQLSEDMHLIHKPFSPQDLRERLRMVLGERA